MKTLRLVGMALFAILMCVNFASCNSDENIPTTEEQEFYTVKLGLGGEIVDITEEPLSRATTDDLYGIQVYSAIDKDLAEGERDEWKPYAYGLFNDLDKMSINLLKGYKYKFAASMVVDGINKILPSGPNSYGYPFSLNKNGTLGSALLDNKFTPSYSDYFNQLDESSSYLNGQRHQTFKRPNTDRYYGILDSYKPLKDGETAEINMKRVGFGAKFIIEKNENISGSLAINIEYAPEISIDLLENEITDFDIYTFYNMKDAYNKDGYTEDVPVCFVWTNDEGAAVSLGTHNITYTRNKTTVVTVKITNAGKDSNIGIKIEDSEKGDMDEDRNNDVTIEDGEIVNTNVGTENEG